MSKNGNTGLIIGGGIGLILLYIMSDDKNSNSNVPSSAAAANFTGGATDFIIKTFPAAMQAQAYTGVPAIVALMFAGLESGFGKHAPKNNFFGTKTGSKWSGDKQLLKTTEVLPRATGYNFPQVISVVPSVKHKGKFVWTVKDYFRAYGSLYEAFVDYGNFVKGGRYKHAFLQTEPLEIVRAIYNAGYATDPDYMSKMAKLLVVIQKVINANFKK